MNRSCLQNAEYAAWHLLTELQHLREENPENKEIATFCLAAHCILQSLRNEMASEQVPTHHH